MFKEISAVARLGGEMRRFIPIILLLAATGCRETEPPPTLFRDLGTDGAPLLPTTPVWKTAAIVNGQAEWHAFREPTSEPGIGDDSGSTPGGGPPDAANAEIEAEIRELIAEFNEIARIGPTDDILDYFVAEQADALKPLVEATLATKTVLQQLRGAFDAKLPAAADRIERVTDAILIDMSLELKGETLTVRSDTEVDVSVSGGVLSQKYRVVIVDDEWYIEVSGAEGFAEFGAALERGLQYYRDMLESVRSGAAPPEDRLQELESAVADAQSDAPAEADPNANPDDVLPVDDDTGG